MSQTINIIDIEKASTGNSRIVSQTIRAYLTTFNLTDFSDNDLITKRAALQIGGISLTVDTIVAGTTIPFFLDVTLYAGALQNSDLLIRATNYDPITGDATGQLKRYYDIDAVEQDTVGDGTGTFTGWNIYGHDDGTGKFKEDTYITIKE